MIGLVGAMTLRRAGEPVQIHGFGGTWDEPEWLDLTLRNVPLARRLEASAAEEARPQPQVAAEARRQPPPGPPTGPAWTWELVRPGPGPLSRHAMAYDEARGRVVLHGGLRGAEAIGETWERRDGAWHRLVGRGPAARHRAAMAYDPVGRRVVLFGGQALLRGGWRVMDDTWVLDGAGWERLDVPVAPPPRCAHHLAWHPGLGGVVLFGGSAGGGPGDRTFGDTWLLEGRSWRRLEVQAGPGARGYAGLAWDPRARAAVLYGGAVDERASGGSLSDTWLLAAAGTWALAQVTASAGPRNDFALCTFGPPIDAVVLACGSGPHGHPAVFAGTGWQTIPAVGGPSLRQCGAMVWDPTLGAGVLYGGEACHGGQQFADTWLLRPPAKPPVTMSGGRGGTRP